MMNNLMQMVQQIKSNPMQFLIQSRINIPQNISNDPTAILNHLLQTGQTNQDAVNRAYQMAQQIGYRR